MKLSYLLLFLIVSLLCTAQQSEIDKVKANLIHDALVNQGYKPRIERYITSDYSKAGHYLKSMNSEGGWDDINYQHRDNNWNPLHHLDRLIVMTYNYCNDTSSWYQNPELLAGIEKSIRYWYTVNPECDNWYKNKIAKQFYFNVIALLTEGKIPEDLHKKMVNDLTEVPTMTGSNRTLLATSTFYKGVLTNNEEMVKLGVTGVTDQIEISTNEGVQPDFSFHQHGHFLYNGSYGLNYLRESAWQATVVHRTKFAYSPEHLKILRDYYLNGTRWMIRGELIDYNVRGRQVGRPDALVLLGHKLYPILKHMSIADPEYADAYLSSSKLIQQKKPQKTIGHKHFYRSDYTIHHREKYSTSLKMCSKRTVGIELNMNSENKLGYWLPYGLTYIYRDGTEYDKIFTVLDWARLPGVTNPHIEIEEKQRGKAHTQQTEFVGGVSDGKYGVSTMDFDKNKTNAKKSWFWFDDEWVALGAGIQSEHEAPIVTSVNQCLLRGDVFVDEKKLEGTETLKKATSVWHDNIAYIFPNANKLKVAAKTQTGNMHRIYGLGKDTVYNTPVFSLWFDHGTQPQKANYQYIVVPGIEKSETKKYAAKLPIEILENSAGIQAVKHNKLNLCSIVFHRAKSLQLSKNFTLKTSHPLIVLLDENKGEISVSEPTGKVNQVKITFSKNGQTITEQQFDFTEVNAKKLYGKTLTQKLATQL